MAPGGTGPKRLTERYEDLAGDEDERRVKYVIWRRLGCPPVTPAALASYENLAWWEEDLAIEGLRWEFTDEDALPTRVEGDAAGLASMGLTVRTPDGL